MPFGREYKYCKCGQSIIIEWPCWPVFKDENEAVIIRCPNCDEWLTVGDLVELGELE